MTTANWLNSIRGSVDSLSSVIAAANWGIAATLLCACILTGITIIASNRRDVLLKGMDLEREERIAKAQGLAAGANERASNADERAAKLEVKAEEARLEQVKVKTENLKLALEVERERVARLEIEERLAPRHVSEKQKAVIVAGLRRMAGKNITIEAASGPEADRFASELADAMQAAGLDVRLNRGVVTVGGNFPAGISVYAPNSESNFVDSVIMVLASAGLVKPPIPSVETLDGIVRFRIGVKP